MSILQINKNIYRALLKIFEFTKDDFLKLELAKLIGQVAFKFHSGNFREEIIEDYFRSFAEKYLSQDLKKTDSQEKENVVHILTTLYETGGHTRLVENLIKLDKKHTHHIYVINQGKYKIPENIRKYIVEQNGKFVADKSSDILSKCNSLFDFVSNQPGNIFLHIHPYDIIPSLTFSKYKDSFDIFFVNHADHAFSYGPDVSSFVINIREEAHNISVNKRGFDKSYVLPLPLKKICTVTGEKRRALRAKYNIKEGEIAAVSIGSAYKFKANKGYDFFRTFEKILDKNSNLKLYIIGLDLLEAEKFGIEVPENSRIFLEGIVKDTSEYQIIADIAVDPIPFGSYTALLETSNFGAYPMVCYGTNPLFDLTRDPALRGLVKMSNSENEYISQFNHLCSNPDYLSEYRKIISESINSWHSGEKCSEIYNRILSKKDFSGKHSALTDRHSYDEEFANLNLDLARQKNSILSFFYSRAEQFSFTETIKIVSVLFNLNFEKRDLLAIFKKNLKNYRARKVFTL